PTRIYVKPVLALAQQVTVRAVSHITGGGFYENIPRCLPEGFAAKIEKAAVKTPAIFTLMQSVGKVPERDMWNTFNMGVGMCVVVPKQDANKAVEILRQHGEDAYIMGEAVKGEGVILC
ncbi:MAG: AIR synthase-related protein, partial [Pygmaiobacter sp.]